MKKNYLTIISAVALVCATAAAQTGTANLQFLKMAVDARGAALASACVAAASDVSSAYWNAGGLARLSDMQFQLSYNSWIAGMSFFHAGYAMHAGPGAFAAALTYLSEGSQSGYDSAGVSTGEFNNSSFAVTGAYGIGLGSRVDIGGAVKFATGSVGDSSVSGFMFDAGVRFRAIENPGFGLTLASAFKNIGYASEKAPMQITIGAAFDAYMNFIVLTPMIATELKFDQKSALNFGMELCAMKQYYVRVGYGYDFGGADAGGAKGLTAGVGARISMVTIDVTWGSMGELGQTFMATAGMKLSAPERRNEQE